MTDMLAVKYIINKFIRRIMKKHFKSRAQGMPIGIPGSNPFNVVKVAFSPSAFNKIRETVGSRPAESGGALFGRPADLRSPIPYITDFVFDSGASTTRATYSINTKFLNPVIHDKWDNHGLELHGILHSHPVRSPRPSGPDMTYFHQMHTYMERPFLITPIVHTQPDGEFRMFCYLVGPDSPAIEVEYCVMDEKEYERAVAESGAAGHEMPGNPEQEDIPAVATVPGEPAEEAAKDADGADGAEKPCVIDYSREEGAVDKALLERSKIVIVGTGGAYEVTCMFARCGNDEISPIY